MSAAVAWEGISVAPTDPTAMIPRKARRPKGRFVVMSLSTSVLAGVLLVPLIERKPELHL